MIGITVTRTRISTLTALLYSGVFIIFVETSSSKSLPYMTKSNGQKGQQMSKTIQLQSKVNSVIVRLHVATTWFELSFCPLVYIRYPTAAMAISMDA